MRKLIVSFFMAVMCASCATLAEQASVEFQANNIVRVNVTGNAFQDREKVRRGIIQRGAIEAHGRGFSHIVIVELDGRSHDVDIKTSDGYYSGSSSTFVNSYGSTATANTTYGGTYTPPTYATFTREEMTGRFLMVTTEEAQFVLENYPTIELLNVLDFLPTE